MKKTLAFVFPLWLVTLSLQANLIWYEGFNYPNGNITNVSSGAWINFSGNASNDMIVVNQQLQVAATSSTDTNSFIKGKSRADDDRRPFATASGSPYTNTVQVVYASFTVICTNLPNGVGSYFASFYNPKSGTGGGYFGRIQAFTNGSGLPKTWRLGVSNNSSSTNAADGGFPVDLALNTPYQVVEELDPTADGLKAATIWINPIDPNDTGSSSSDPKYTAQGDSIGAATTTPVTDYAFRQASSFGNSFFLITNLATATTFGEAMTNVWSTNAVAPVIVYQPSGFTNFEGASISLSAVADGQGLGSLTYQWLQNGNPYPGGNANVLNIPSAQAGDSGDYTLVVTTPYGLSVTSTVASVLISVAPVPPSFSTQPVSQNAYSGQTVIFSTTVTSPGNVTYQWKSNNVNIPFANGSTLELDNVQPSFSASYSVGVTNDVVPNGVVSSNAVLVVQNPATVSIAYLRTLVDPQNGYSPTNSPPTIPYQVTGTITTFTNITSGNTASYYLQDGTGGINVFATFGSTFRPAQGDVVTWVGVLSGFTSGLELYADPSGAYPYTSYTDTGTTAPLPTPIDISFDVTNDLANVNYNIAGSLVKLSDVYFGTNAGTVLSTTANQTVTVTNSAGKKFNLFFAFVDTNTAGMTLPSYASSVTGVMYGINTSFSVAVTKFSDIDTNTVTPLPIPLNLTYSGGTITFNWSDASFSLQSSTNVAGPYVTISGAASGFSTNTTFAPTVFFRLYHP